MFSILSILPVVHQLKPCLYDILFVCEFELDFEFNFMKVYVFNSQSSKNELGRNIAKNQFHCRLNTGGPSFTTANPNSFQTKFVKTWMQELAGKRWREQMKARG